MNTEEVFLRRAFNVLGPELQQLFFETPVGGGLITGKKSLKLNMGELFRVRFEVGGGGGGGD